MNEESLKRPQLRYIFKSARTGKATIATNVRECPLTYYHHRRWLDDEQYYAGMKFRDIYEAASISNKAIDWDAQFGPTEKRDLPPKQAEAFHELRRLSRSTSKVGRALLFAVCAEGRSAKEFEKAAGWRDRYGIERLREALDDIAEALGLIHRRLEL